MHLVPCGFGRDRLQLLGERGPDGLDELRSTPDKDESGRQRNDAPDEGKDEGGEEGPTCPGHPNLVGQDRALIRHAGPEANRGERVEPAVTRSSRGARAIAEVPSTAARAGRTSAGERPPTGTSSS